VKVAINKEVIVGAWKIWAAIAGSALVVTACGGSKDQGGGEGCTPKGGSQATAAQTIKLQPDPNTVGKFDPKEVNVKVGQAVEWDWVDSSAQHTVTADDNSSFDSCLVGQGSKFIVTFTKAGKVPYHCTIHAGMIGTVNVSQ